MSEQDKVLNAQLERMRREILKNSTNQSEDDTFKDMIDDAKLVFLNKVYPFDKDKTEKDIPSRYTGWVTRCAIELYYLHDEGDYSSYSENALAWTKEEMGLSSKLLGELPPPQAGVPK